MELVIGWILFGVAAGAVAKTKGRNIWLWGAVGLAIGPFAALILAFLPTTDKGDQAYH